MLLRKKEEIENWLNKYQIKDYDLIKDEKYGYVVNVNGHVNLINKNLTVIEVKFNQIKGSFNCSSNELETLKGCPEVVNIHFNCNNNKLKDLKNSPKIVNGNFFCYYNYLNSLEGCPKIIKGSLIVNNNELEIEGLKYLPKEITTNYIDIFNNEKLEDLQKISNFSELKEKLNIYFEKENLLKSINKEDLNKNNSINKI